MMLARLAFITRAYRARVGPFVTRSMTPTRNLVRRAPKNRPRKVVRRRPENTARPRSAHFGCGWSGTRSLDEKPGPGALRARPRPDCRRRPVLDAANREGLGTNAGVVGERHGERVLLIPVRRGRPEPDRHPGCPPPPPPLRLLRRPVSRAQPH